MVPELQFLEQLVRHKLNKYFPSSKDESEPVLSPLNEWKLPLKKFVWENRLNYCEAVILLVGIAPHLQPDLFDRAIESKIAEAGNFPKIGGVRGKNSRSFLPTGDTVLFLLADNNFDLRHLVNEVMGADHLFSRKKILWLEELAAGEPAMSGRIIMSQDYIDTFVYGAPSAPHFSMTFPAKRIETQLTWDDLVINDRLREQIREIEVWMKYNDELMKNWGMEARLRKGYRTLFYGPPGTGKTFTAGLIGKYANGISGNTRKDVYKIDLSMVVSKYIGETEKNLEMLFARAEDKGWILFFDEADALFGKRTNIRDAHDKYANQEVSYLLQRIEDYPGLIILATNMKNNIDDAFLRRFNSILKFPFPEANDRMLIWQKSFPKKGVFLKKPVFKINGSTLHENQEPIDIPEAVKNYQMTGGNIINIVHYASLKAIERSKDNNIETVKISPGTSHQQSGNYETGAEESLIIYLEDVLDGIRNEMIKAGQPFA